MRHVLKSRPAMYLAALVISLSWLAPAHADNTEPARFLESFGQRAIHVLRDTQPGTHERESQLRSLLNDHFDVDFISRFVVARFWRSSSADERTEFRRVFEDYVIAAYGRRFGSFNGEQFTVGQTFAQDDNWVIVRSEVVRSSGEKLTVDWRMHRREGDGTWRIVDIVVEGVSMMVTQRSEFGAVLQREGSLTALNAKLRQIIASLTEQEKGSAPS